MWTQWLTLILQARNNKSRFALNTSHVQHHDRIWLPSTQSLPEVWLHGPKGVEMRNVSERRGSNSYLHLPVRQTLWIDFPWPETQSITNPLCFICTHCQKDPASDPVYAYLRCVRKPKVNAWFNFIFFVDNVYRNLKSCSLIVVNEESLKCFSCITQRHLRLWNIQM